MLTRRERGAQRAQTAEGEDVRLEGDCGVSWQRSEVAGAHIRRASFDERSEEFGRRASRRPGSSASEAGARTPYVLPRSGASGRSEAFRSGQVRSGQVRSGQVRSGQVRSGQRLSGQVRGPSTEAIERDEKVSRRLAHSPRELLRALAPSARNFLARHR